MIIRKVTENKRQYMELLLLADEQEEMIDKYIDRGTMYVLDDNGVKAECVVTDEGGRTLEIKNIAVYPEFHGRGYGRMLIDYISEIYSQEFDTLQVGTGDSPLTVPFYEKYGIPAFTHRKEFFYRQLRSSII